MSRADAITDVAQEVALQVGRKLTDPAFIGALAEALDERQGERQPERLLTAAEAARFLAGERSWVYEHKEELGVIKLGASGRPRLRFDPEALRHLGAHDHHAPAVAPAPERLSARRRPSAEVPLLPIRGEDGRG